MMKLIWHWHPGKAAILFGLAGIVVFALMTFQTLAHIEELSGEVPFDLRPLGYGIKEAVQILDGLEKEGRFYYLSRQIPLDTIYPALLSLTLISLIQWLRPPVMNEKLIHTGFVLSVGAAVFDYAENLGIVAMILSWPNQSLVLVTVTSIASVTKSILTTLAVILVLVLGIIALTNRKANRPDES